MSGLVSWKSEHLREEWGGEVEKCVKQGNRINLVFSCTDLGEGQITLVDTDEVQVVTSRFLYYGQQAATQVSVRGRFLRHSEALAFEGVWTDPVDGTGQWTFTIDLDTDTVPELRRLSPSSDEDEISTEQIPFDEFIAYPPVTDWYPINLDPVRPGLYQVRFNGQAEKFSYANWDGAKWSIDTPSSGVRSGTRPRVNLEIGNMTSWRGLTEAGALQTAVW